MGLHDKKLSVRRGWAPKENTISHGVKFEELPEGLRFLSTGRNSRRAMGKKIKSIFPDSFIFLCPRKDSHQ